MPRPRGGRRRRGPTLHKGLNMQAGEGGVELDRARNPAQSSSGRIRGPSRAKTSGTDVKRE
eukprot:9537061-Lingulodinium_polyedra.AAC.1